MKKVLIPAVLLAILAMVMPYITGRVAETVTTELAKQVSAQQSEYGNLDVIDYQRGYRTSQFALEWNAPVQLQPVFPDPVVYNCDGSHGILSFDYLCRAKNVPNYTEFVNTMLEGSDPISIGGEVTVFGAFTKHISLAPFTARAEDGSVVSVAAGNLEVSTNKDMAMFDLYGDFGGMTMTADNDELTVRPARMTGSLQFNQHQIALGTVDVTSEGVILSSAGSNQMEVGRTQLVTFSEAEGDKLRAGYDLSVTQLSQQMGAEAELSTLDDLKVKTIAHGVDMQKLSEISRRLRELAQYDARDSLSAEEESSRNAQMLAMLPELEDLLIAGVGVEFAVSAELEQQNLEANLEAELLKDLSLGDFVLLSVEPAAFFRKLDFDLSASLPIDFVETNQASAVAIANSKLFQRGDNAYQAALSIEGEEIELNGKPMTVSEFMEYFELGRRRR